MRGVIRIYRVAIVAIVLLTTVSVAVAQSPKLVINIVASTMRAGDIDRYGDNFFYGGLKRLADGGVHYTAAYHDYALTSTATGLATFATGAQPAVHSVIGQRWWNYLDSSLVELIADRKASPVEFSTGSGGYSAHRLSAPTMGDMLLSVSPRSKQYTIAIDALSAIVMNGKAGIPFWMESNQTHWTTSSAYVAQLPAWVKSYNSEDQNRQYMTKRWTPLHKSSLYHNLEVAILEGISGKETKLVSEVDLTLNDTDYGRMCYTPAGNTAILQFAAHLIAKEGLGSDSATDILNISLDTSRYIAETYGPESMEYEDMLYRLDKDIAEFLNTVYQHATPSDIVVVFSAAHGTSPSYNPVGKEPIERFNIRQMEVIVNAFLGARYGSEDYILGFANNSIYLNHQLILSKRLSLESIREEVATFLLQLRGVRTALSASALRNTSFAEGRSRLIQQSFYATRSGDVIIDLIPGWTIEDGERRSSADGGYNYDRHVPLIIYGGGLKHNIVERVVSITELAPTICSMIGIDAPWASSEQPLEEIN